MAQHLQHIQQKVLSEEFLLKTIGHWKAQNEKIVFTNVCFDILLRRHIEYL